ncbi:MAG: hypothetical protein AAGA78_01155, partial [Pseudomonadota bacterium]
QEMSERLASEDVGIDWDEPPLWVVLVAYLGAGALVIALFWAFVGSILFGGIILFMGIFLIAAGCYRYATHTKDWWIDLRMVLGATLVIVLGGVGIAHFYFDFFSSGSAYLGALLLIWAVILSPVWLIAVFAVLS